MKIRKPNRVTTPRRAVLNGTKTSHASMPRARGRWRYLIEWRAAGSTWEAWYLHDGERMRAVADGDQYHRT